MAQVDKPNLVLPLAASYNQRDTQAVTIPKDQRKINCVYEIAANSQTGSRTVYLAKRSGWSNFTTLASASTDAPFSAVKPSSDTATPWVFSYGSVNKNTVSNDASSTVILNSTTYRPSTADKTSISGTEYIYVQYRSGSDSDYLTKQRIFYASTIGSWTEITDADFASLFIVGKMEPMDGYLFGIDSLNRVYNSDLNSLANWTATSYITKSIEQDVPRGLIKHGRMLLAFGGATVEPFYNAGNASGSPLARIPALAQRIGLPKNGVVDGTRRSYYASLENRTYFVGVIGDSTSTGTSAGVFAFDGSRFERVSNPGIEARLWVGGLGITLVQRMVFQGQQAIAISTDAPAVAGDTQRWFMFFPRWNEWFEFASNVFQPSNAEGFYLGFQGATVNTNQTLFIPNAGNNWVDGSGNTAYTMTHQFKLPQTGADRKRMHFAGVIGDTQTSASDLSISFSDDDYQTFSTARTIDLTKDKKQIYRCGNYRGRAVKLEHSANTDCRLEAFIARVE